MAKTKFEIYKDNKGNYRWRLLAQNGEPVASSGEGFAEKRTAMNAVKKLKDWSNTTNILDLEKMKEEAAKAKAKPAKKSDKKVSKPTAKPVKKSAKPAAKPKAKPVSKPAKKAEKKVENMNDEGNEVIISKTVL